MADKVVSPNEMVFQLRHYLLPRDARGLLQRTELEARRIVSKAGGKTDPPFGLPANAPKCAIDAMAALERVIRLRRLMDDGEFGTAIVEAMALGSVWERVVKGDMLKQADSISQKRREGSLKAYGGDLACFQRCQEDWKQEFESLRDENSDKVSNTSLFQTIAQTTHHRRADTNKRFSYKTIERAVKNATKREAKYGHA